MTAAGIARRTARLGRAGLTVEPPVEITIEGSDVAVAIVAAVSDADIPQAVEVAVEGTDVAITVIGAAVEIAIAGADVVVAAGRAGIAEPVEGSDIARAPVHVAEIPVGLRRAVAIAIAISIASASVAGAVEVAVQDSDISVPVSVAASCALCEQNPGILWRSWWKHRFGADDECGSEQLSAGENSEGKRCRLHGALRISGISHFVLAQYFDGNEMDMKFIDMRHR
jgi:hypothetical protein